MLGSHGGGFLNGVTVPKILRGRMIKLPLAVAHAGGPAGAQRVIGTGWLSVVATPPSPQVANALKQALSRPQRAVQTGSATYGMFSSSSSSSSAYSSTLSIGQRGQTGHRAAAGAAEGGNARSTAAGAADGCCRPRC